jgi:uncharacterized protein YggE
MSQILSNSLQRRSRYLPKKFRPMLAVLFTVGLLSLTMTTEAMAQERRLRTLTVTGRGTESIPTTKTSVQLGVEVQGKTAASVQQEVAERSSAVVELLRSRNVEKLETTGIRLNPVYSYENDVQRLTGYSASNIVSFRYETTQVGSLLDDAVKAGATRIDNVSFTASDEAIASAQKQALREATQEAQAQADAVLSALNLSRQDVVSIQIDGAIPPIPMPMPMYEGAALARDAKTPVIGGDQEVQAAVTLEISYEN